jgi:hypothetical protein
MTLTAGEVDSAPAGTPKIERLIALEEGFYIQGSVPNRNHNPGDLRHSPHSFHTAAAPDAVGQIDNDADGWADMSRQLRLYITESAGTCTVAQAIFKWAPTSENNTSAYLSFILDGAPKEGITGLGCPGETLLSDALLIMGDPHAALRTTAYS